MIRNASLLALQTMLLLTLALAPAAGANATSKILEACGKGEAPSGYSQQDYRKALTKIPPYLSEYSDCPELIRKAQLAAAARSRGGPSAGGGGPGTAGAGSTSPSAATPTERKALTHAHREGSTPLQVGDQVIHPGVVHANVASAVNTLPTPLLVVLALLLACALPLLGGALRNRIRARRLG